MILKSKTSFQQSVRAFSREDEAQIKDFLDMIVVSEKAKTASLLN